MNIRDFNIADTAELQVLLRAYQRGVAMQIDQCFSDEAKYRGKGMVEGIEYALEMIAQYERTTLQKNEPEAL